MVVTGVATKANQSLVGMSTQEIADARGCDPVDAFLDLLVEEAGHVNAVLFSMSEEDMNLALTHPLGCVATDGLAFAPDGPLAATAEETVKYL